MNRLLLTLLLGITGFNALAQNNGAETAGKNQHADTKGCPPIYITTSTGINNNTGLIGFSFDVPVSRNISIDAGAGNGTWDYKIYAGIKYYLRPCHRGFAVGAGITYCTGLADDERDLKTIYGNTESIEYNKNPQTNLLVSACKYWNLGRRNNRWYVQAGWSVPVTSRAKITQLTGHPMTSDTRYDLGFYAPGGFIAAIGVSFGVH